MEEKSVIQHVKHAQNYQVIILKIFAKQMQRKNSFLRLFLLFTFIVTASRSYSQVPISPGYIILNNHDTIYGRIENSHLGSIGKCIIIKNGTSKIHILKPEQVNGFFIYPDSYFQPQKIEGKYTFLQLISEGKVNLYSGDMNLYISSGSGNLVQLDGKKKYFNKDGKTYSIVNRSYKECIRASITDTSYYPKIDKLVFDKSAIIVLIKEINGHETTSLKDQDYKIFHKNQFSLGLSYSTYAYHMKNLDYKNDSFYVSYDGRIGFNKKGNNPKLKLNAWQIEFSYKRNITSTNLYLYGGLQYCKLQKTSLERLGLLHSSISFESDGTNHYTDTIGRVTDQFHYDIAQISLPVGFYHEISHNLLRPFYSFGFSGNYFLKRSVLLNRTVYLNNIKVQEDELKLDIPSFSLGAELELGCRFLINANYSLSGGVNLNTLIKEQSNIIADFNLTSRSFYLSFNF